MRTSLAARATGESVVPCSHASQGGRSAALASRQSYMKGVSVTISFNREQYIQEHTNHSAMDDDTAPPAIARDRGSLRAHAVPLAILAVITIVSKIPTIGTAAYWDEMGWLSQAAWLSERNLVSAIPGFREPSAFWGHPPGLHLILAALGKAFGGVTLTLAHSLMAVFSAVGVCATYLLARRSFDPEVAWTASLLLLLCPLYFAQSGMFLADVPVAALGVLAAFLSMTGRIKAYLVCASCMVLLKETAAAVVVAIVIHKFIMAGPARRKRLRELSAWGIPLLAIGAFVLVQRIATGHFFWIYDFEVHLFRLNPSSVVRQFGEITRWIFFEQNRIVFTVLIGLALLFRPASRRRHELRLFALILALSGWSFSFLYLLPRYLTPVLPLFFVVAAGAVFDLLRRRPLRIAANAALVLVSAFGLVSQPMWGNGETTLRYLSVIAINDSAANRLSRDYPRDSVVSVFPNADALLRPLLGYVDRPLYVRQFRDSSDIEHARVILVSSPSEPAGNELWELAQRDPWRRIARYEVPGAWTELYAMGSPATRSGGEQATSRAP